MLSRMFLILVAFSFLAAVSVSHGGTITGSIGFEGKKPKRKKLRMGADPYCKSSHKKKVRNNSVMIKKKKVQNVFVYIKSGLTDAQKSATKPSTNVVLNQSKCLYSPKVVGVQVGQQLKIINSDTTLHNVHAYSKNNSDFNQAMPQKGSSIERTFAKPEIGLRFKCDVHPWMEAFVNVMDHPFFAVSNKKGEFTIKDVPDGEYEVVAWHQKLGTQTAMVKVTGSAKVDLKFSK